jgi:hypothetical protein
VEQSLPTPHAFRKRRTQKPYAFGESEEVKRRAVISKTDKTERISSLRILYAKFDFEVDA